MSIERMDMARPDSVHPGGLVITEEFIRERLGMVLAMIFPAFETDAAGIVEHGDELERIGKLCGYGNVIASLYFEEGKLQLGIFVREESIPGNIIDASDIDSGHTVSELD